MRAVSKKRAAENRRRTEVLRPMREEQPWCSRCGKTGVGLDADEIKSTARGGSRTDPENLQLLCRSCHDWKHVNDAQAIEDGWALNSWDAS